MSLGKSDQVLVTIELPSDLCVSNLIKVQIRHSEPRAPRGALAMDGIEMPVDPRSVIHNFITKQVEPVLANLIRLHHDSLYDLGHPLAQTPSNSWHFGGGEKEATRTT